MGTRTELTDAEQARTVASGRVLLIAAALCGVAAMAAWIGRTTLQGGPNWALTDAVLHAVFWLLLAGAAVLSAGALGFWPGPAPGSRRRGLVLGGLLGLLAVVGSAVSDWIVFTSAPSMSQPLQFFSFAWGGILDFLFLMGAFLIAVSLIGLLTHSAPDPRHN